MERELAFSTLVKLMELPSNQKMATLRGFMRGGGFNYWRPLQNLAPEVVKNGIDLAELSERVSILSKGHQRKYNEAALIKLMHWVRRRRVEYRNNLIKVVEPFGSSGLSVRIEPEACFSMSGQKYVMHIWATNTPTLSEETLSMALYLFRAVGRKHDFREYQYLLFDSVKDRIFTEVNILGNSQEMLRSALVEISQLWQTISDIGPRPSTPSHPTPSQPPV
jgi:hypothetical protein